MQALDLQSATGSLADAQIAAAKSSALAADGEKAALRKAAEDFEAVFLGQMLQPMFSEIGQDPLLGGGPGEEIYRGMLVEELGKEFSRSGGIGLADQVYKELLKLQEASHGS